MGRGFIKLADDAYVEWSTIVDAPVSEVLNRAEALAQAGDPARIERCDRNGTSFLDVKSTGPEYVAYNRAGAGESTLTVAEIIEQYAPPALPREDGTDA